MTNLGDLTVAALLEQLREEEARARADYVDARRRLDRARAAISAIESIADERQEVAAGQEQLPEDQLPVEINEEADEALRGEAAVLSVIRRNPRRVWTAGMIHRHLEREGWINEDARHPRAGTEAALSRLVHKEVLHRVAPGRYRVRDYQALMP